MLKAGINRENFVNVIDEQLYVECEISNSIHRQRIMSLIEDMNSITDGVPEGEDQPSGESFDVFISYRRINGSQLASLLKVNLQQRGFSVFIDVEGLDAGKFGSNLLLSIERSKFFLLVLTSRALDLCCGDEEGNDWVHREIVTALQSNCKIIPIIENFKWPRPEALPEDMRGICNFNGVYWIHDYQGACIDKLERFMRGKSDSVLENCTNPGCSSSKYFQEPKSHRQLSIDSGQPGFSLTGSMSMLAMSKSRKECFITGGSMMELRLNSPSPSRKLRSQIPVPSRAKNQRSHSLDMLLDDER